MAANTLEDPEIADDVCESGWKLEACSRRLGWYARDLHVTLANLKQCNSVRFG
jgi:hypothetical protein